MTELKKDLRKEIVEKEKRELLVKLKQFMEKQQMNQDQLLELLNQCLYAYVYAESKQVEKQQVRNIKQIKKVLKKQFNKKVAFNKKELVYVFKN